MIRLVEISEENFAAVLALQLKPEQVNFVAPVVRSLAECYLYRHNGDVFPYAIYDEEVCVGFLLLELNEEDQEFIIWRLLIDQAHQGKGYGRQVIAWAIERAKADARFTCVLADYRRGNTAMAHLLLTCGFKETAYKSEVDEFEMTYNWNEGDAHA